MPRLPPPADPSAKYVASIDTDAGIIEIELWPDLAPQTVGNFVGLAESGFYDGTVFHRVIRGFMIQGGCPRGDGRGGPDYQFQDEFNERKLVRGVLAMANAGPNTNGSQFFIVTAPGDTAPRRRAHGLRRGERGDGRGGRDRGHAAPPAATGRSPISAWWASRLRRPTPRSRSSAVIATDIDGAVGTTR